MLAPLLYALLLGPPAALPRIVREGERVVLVDGRDRLLLRGSPESRVPLGAGAELLIAGGFSTELRLLREGRKVGKVDMVDLGFSWLQQNSIWGGEAGANLAREEAFRISGMRAELREALPIPGGALAIVTWRTQPFSTGLVWAQHLVRVEAGSNLETTPLRLLRGGRGSYVAPTTRRLFRYGKKILLWVPGQLIEIRTNGTDIRSFAQVPGELAPIGVVDNRWVLLAGDELANSLILGTVDLSTGKTSVSLREPARSGGLRTTVSEIPQRGRYLLLTRALDARGTVERLTIEVPSGRRVKILSGTRVPPNCTWKEYAYADDGVSIVLYDARTGRYLGDLPVPRRAKTPKIPPKPRAKGRG